MPLLHTKCTASIQQGHFTCVCDVNIAISLTGILWPLQVFHIHVFLGLQDILRLWIYAARLHHTCRRHRLCYHRVHLLPAECRGLSVVSVYCCEVNEGRLCSPPLIGNYHEGAVCPP